MGYGQGTSEEFIGRAIRHYVSRKDVIIATKFVPRTSEEIEKGITG